MFGATEDHARPPPPTVYIHRSPTCHRCCKTCTLCTATGKSSPPASCCQWTADMWGDLRRGGEERREEWRWKEGWGDGAKQSAKFSYVRADGRVRAVSLNRSWQQRKTDTHQYIYIIHQKLIYTACSCICFRHCSAVMMFLFRLSAAVVRWSPDVKFFLLE